MKSSYYTLLFLLSLICSPSLAQPMAEPTSDSIIVEQLRQEGVTFSHNNRIRLLTSGQEKFDDMFQAISEARSSVHLEYFNFRNDSIAMLLFNLLAEKAAQGVEVRALYDAFGNSSNNRPLKNRHIRKLRSQGIQIYEFDPLNFPWINHVFSRDHRKIVVIDGQIAYTGGMNVADYYINGTEQVGSWRDMHCRIEGDEVNTLQRIFMQIWEKTTGERLQGAKYYYGQYTAPYFTPIDSIDTNALPPSPPTQAGIINREPEKTNRIIRSFYYHAIDDAKDSIKLINPYLTLNRKLKRKLREAAERGVKVEIMASTHSDIPLTPDCMFYNLHHLMKKGVEVWMYEPGFHHTKVIMVDGRFCTVGSANLNARSLRWDYEENAVIIDRHITQQLCDLFDADKRDSFRLTPDTWNQFRTPWQKFRGWFAHLLAPFL